MPYSDYHWITDRLAIGGMVSEHEDGFPFDTVLSMETHSPATLRPLLRSGQVEYQWRSIVDGMSWETNDEIVRRFDEAAALIDAWQSAGKCTLVHCFAGVSRSVTAVIWYFMRYQGMSWDEAIEMIRRARSHANPNIRFEIPLRLESGEDLNEAAIQQLIEAYCARLNAQYGADLKPEEIWADLEKQGTTRRIGISPS